MEAHEVGGDEAIADFGAEDVGLNAIVCGEGPAPEARGVEALMRIAIFWIARRWHQNLVEIGVVRVPELVAPCAVEGFDVAVFFAEPFAEGGVGNFGLIEWIAVFVVDLPADDRGMISESIGHGFDDAAGGVVEFGREGIVMTAPAEAADDSAFILRQGLRGLFAKPDWGGCRGGAEDDVELSLFGEIDAVA